MAPVTFAGICFVEILERLAFYALISVFTMYLTNVKGMSQQESSSLYGELMLGIYGLPILGGWLSDRIVGTKRALLAGIGLLTLGYLLLVLPHWLGLVLPLVLLCLGSGLFKPSLLAVVAPRSARNGSRSEADFVWLYISISIGARLGTVLAGFTSAELQMSDVFKVCTVSTAIALLVAIGLSRKLRLPSESSDGESGDPKPIDWRQLISLGTSLALCEFGLRHLHLVRTLWSREHVDHTFGGQIPLNLGIALLDPGSERAYVLVLAPLILTLLAVLRRKGILVTTLQKVSIVMALQLLACLLLVRASFLATDGTAVPAGWLLGVQVFTALPGFLLYPFALSLFARLVPGNRFGTMFGLWIVLHGLVNYLTGLSVARALRFPPAAVFAIPTLLVLGGVCLWISQLRRLQLALQSPSATPGGWR